MNMPEPSAAPAPVVRAVLETVSLAMAFARNWAIDDEVPRKQIHDLLDAAHETPNLLLRWNEGSMEELLCHLGCFSSEEWPDTLDLVTLFKDRLDRPWER